MGFGPRGRGLWGDEDLLSELLSVPTAKGAPPAKGAPRFFGQAELRKGFPFQGESNGNRTFSVVPPAKGAPPFFGRADLRKGPP